MGHPNSQPPCLADVQILDGLLFDFVFLREGRKRQVWFAMSLTAQSGHLAVASWLGSNVEPAPWKIEEQSIV